jgi:hypothetical protein
MPDTNAKSIPTGAGAKPVQFFPKPSGVSNGTWKTLARGRRASMRRVRDQLRKHIVEFMNEHQ